MVAGVGGKTPHFGEGVSRLLIHVGVIPPPPPMCKYGEGGGSISCREHMNL